MKHTIRHITASLLLIVLMTTALPAYAAQPVWIDSLEVSGGVSVSKSAPPFWMQANQDGRISRESGSSFFSRLRMQKHADDAKAFDWMYGIDFTSRTNSDLDLVWTDAYAGLAYKMLHLTVGRKSEFFGLADSLLTAGPEVYSRNAPTIPKIALSTNGYVGITDWLAFNAYLAHGWMGEKQYVKDAYLHQKFLYLRLGGNNPDKGVNLYTGIHHLAVWGGDANPSGLNDFADVFLGKSGGENTSGFEQGNAIGDHRGTIEFALKQKGSNRDWLIYTQTMFEDGSGLRFWKPGDYFIGLSLINKTEESCFARLNVEYLDTRLDTASHVGTDNYLTNFVYRGWVHEGYGIGHPFIRFSAGSAYAYDPQNRVRGMNAGVLLRFCKLVNPRFRVAYFENYGSFDSPLPDNEKTSMVACDLTNTSTIAKGWTLTQQISLDTAKSVEPNPGALLTLTRSFL